MLDVRGGQSSGQVSYGFFAPFGVGWVRLIRFMDGYLSYSSFVQAFVPLLYSPLLFAGRQDSTGAATAGTPFTGWFGVGIIMATELMIPCHTVGSATRRSLRVKNTSMALLAAASSHIAFAITAQAQLKSSMSHSETCRTKSFAKSIESSGIKNGGHLSRRTPQTPNQAMQRTARSRDIRAFRVCHPHFLFHGQLYRSRGR
jgi:hypothetical protein